MIRAVVTALWLVSLIFGIRNLLAIRRQGLGPAHLLRTLAYETIGLLVLVLAWADLFVSGFVMQLAIIGLVVLAALLWALSRRLYRPEREGARESSNFS